MGGRVRRREHEQKQQQVARRPPNLSAHTNPAHISSTSDFGLAPTSCPSSYAGMATSPSVPKLDQYRDLVELHKGLHSTVWSCRDSAKDSVVVIKSYCKETMQPRHIRNVVREKRLLQVFNESK